MTSVLVSRADTPTRSPPTRPPATSASAAPKVTPAAVLTRQAPTTRRASSAGDDPSARRIPVSRVRLATSSASNPYKPSDARLRPAAANPSITCVVARRATSWSERMEASEAGFDTGTPESNAVTAARASAATVSGETFVRISSVNCL